MRRFKLHRKRRCYRFSAIRARRFRHKKAKWFRIKRILRRNRRIALKKNKKMFQRS